jgi:predicted CXXCH cytochrome family protein
MEILFPVSSDVKAVSNMHVIGKSDESAPAEVSINGVKNTKKLIAAKDKAGRDFYMLMTILKLDDGENIITITQGTRTKTFKITKVDSPVSISDWTESLSGFHKSGRREICMNCHNFENLSDCVNCHRDKFIGTWVHPPVKQAKCFECHDKEKNFIPQEPFAETCLKCHAKLKENLETSAFTHGPVAAGFCTICHSPHKSTDKTHLRKPVNELCGECHVSGEQGFSVHSKSYIKFHPVDKVFVKKLNKVLECSDCHNPHYADNSMMLSVSGGEENLCVKCHEAENTKELLKTLADKYGSQ